MIHTFIIDNKVYRLTGDVKSPKDCSICSAYISQDGDVFDHLYFHGFREYDLDKLHKSLSDKQRHGCNILIVQCFKDIQIRPLDIVRWIEDTTWVGIVKEGDENHFCVEWFDNDRRNCSIPKCAWHSIEEGKVEKIANLQDIISKCMAHPFGVGTSKPYEIV